MNLVTNLATRLLFSLTCATTAAVFLTATNPADAADVDAGKTASATCAACHGANGQSASDQFPHLAGQVPGYIAAQLTKYQSGERADPVMSAMAAPLSAEDIANLDAYYSGLEGAKGAITPEQEADALAGGKLYRGGYAPYNIPPCMSCHGPSGLGIPPAFPRISGQPAAYIEAQLLAYKSETRQDTIMNPIAFPLSAAQIKELALYISALY